LPPASLAMTKTTARKPTAGRAESSTSQWSFEPRWSRTRIYEIPNLSQCFKVRQPRPLHILRNLNLTQSLRPSKGLISNHWNVHSFAAQHSRLAVAPPETISEKVYSCLLLFSFILLYFPFSTRTRSRSFSRGNIRGVRIFVGSGRFCLKSGTVYGIISNYRLIRLLRANEGSVPKGVKNEYEVLDRAADWRLFALRSGGWKWLAKRQA
jgi:hypothetical protein